MDDGGREARPGIVESQPVLLPIVICCHTQANGRSGLAKIVVVSPLIWTDP
jgi:hypothetical protein